MNEINDPKEFCNTSVSGTQIINPKKCDCVANIVAGPNIALTPNADGSVTISATVADTDTRLNNPHFGAGAPTGFSRLFYDLVNVITGTTITADFSYVDMPLETVTNITGNIYTNEAGTPQPVVQTNVMSVDASGNLTSTVNGVASTPLSICPAVKYCETQTTIDTLSLTGTDLTLTYTGENGIQQTKTVSLASLAIDINVTSLTYNPLSGEITLVETDGTVHVIDIGPFVETQTTLDSIAVNGTNLEVTYTGENGVPQVKSLPICDIVSVIPEVDLLTDQTCLDIEPVIPVVPSHSIERTDSTSDTFVEVTHHDGFGTDTIVQFEKYKTASSVVFAGGGAATGNSGDFWLDNSMQLSINNVFGYNTELNFTVRIELDTNDIPASLDLASVGFGIVNQTTGVPNGVDAIGDYGTQLYTPDLLTLSATKYTYVGSANLTLVPGVNNLIMYMRILTQSGNPYQFTFGPHKVMWVNYLTHA